MVRTFSMRPTNNLRVKDYRLLAPPSQIVSEIPMTEAASETVATTREDIRRLLHGDDRRLLVVVGPCSIHDVAMAQEYAQFVAQARRDYASSLLILMRVYFEKPRTTVGWKGLINDPHLDGSYDVETGLRIGRRLLVSLAEQGIPAASEVLDPISPQYLAEAIAWAAIGARTVESQTHREMASGLSMPIGLKNGTDGSLQTAFNAMKSASQSHHFLGVDATGRVAIVETSGNPDTHLVLRGGLSGPNYDEAQVIAAAEDLRKAGLPSRVMIDCSHDNSLKDYARQPAVLSDIAAQIQRHNNVLGVMIESNLVAGKQAFPPAPGVALRHGQSITDGCVGLDATRDMLDQLATAFAKQPVR
jgi:3-deoxy-7-phosphoheptulonate synthase